MSEPDGKTYRIETLSDFWALGDAERIRRAFKEIGMGFGQMKNLEALMGVPAAPPPFIDWIDDGGKFVDIAVKCGDEKVMDFNMTLGEDFHGCKEPE